MWGQFPVFVCLFFNPDRLKRTFITNKDFCTTIINFTFLYSPFYKLLTLRIFSNPSLLSDIELEKFCSGCKHAMYCNKILSNYWNIIPRVYFYLFVLTFFGDAPPPGGGYSWEFLVGVCCADLQILTLFQTKQYYFSLAFCGLGCKIHTRFQTWLLRNYVIITWIRTPTKTILKIHFGHGWWAPVDLELKRQIGSYTPVVPLKTIP